MGFFSKKKKDELVLVFDIGSSSVGGAFFMMKENGSPEIIYSFRESIIVLEELEINSFLTNTLKALKIVVAQMCLKGIGKPEKIFCVLSLPWFHPETRIIKYSKDESFVFNHKLVNSLIEKEVESVVKSYNQDVKNQTIIPIEMKTMGVSLNGYEIENPENQKAKELELFTFYSLSEKDFLDKVEEEIQKHFHYKTIKFSSFLISSFTVARDMFVNYDRFLLINIGGELTELSLIKKQKIKDNLSFPMGCNFILRGLAKNLNLDIKEARNYLLMYKDNHLSDKANPKIEENINILKNEWLKNFQNSLNNLSGDVSLPATVFITVDQDLAPFFSEIIKGDQLNQYSLTEDKFKIIFLSTEALHGIVTFRNNDFKKDSLLIIESIYINRFFNK